jgi:hypothetical protein
MIRFALVVLAIASLPACGGGGDANAEQSVKPLSSISTLSYENRRFPELYSESLPIGIREPLARTFYPRPDGTLGFYGSNIKSYPGQPGVTAANAVPGPSYFFKKVNDTWVNTTDELYDTANSVPNCIHPRKVIPADFNNDGVIDFAIACHGWDAAPFPGERSRIILSQSDGRYKQEYLTSSAEFNHGGTAGDLNGDGYPDIMLTKMGAGIDVYLNDKTGHFVKSSDYSIPQQKRAFHIALVDINGDGKFDFIGGSHEWDDSTRIIINRGDNNFGGSLFNRPTEIIIPPVTGAGVITDFLYVKAINSLYIVRTGDGKSSGTKFYKGLWLQKFNLDTKVSTVEYANPNWSNPSAAGWSWLPWVVERNGKIVSDTSNWFEFAIN